VARVPRGVVASWALAASVLACSADRIVVDSGLPGLSAAAVVVVLAERHDYLDTSVETGGTSYRFFFPRTETCRALIADPSVRFRLDGVLATLQNDDASCDAAGVLSLREWRSRQGRTARQQGGNRSPITRDRIEYRVVYDDEDLWMALGRFRLAGEIGWPGGVDTLAIFPNSEACAGLKDKVRASMEFREAGEPFTVIDGSTLCPVLGFARPLEKTSTP
jgi:hypothetical protein